MAPDRERIECATYTHARRHPMVLGKIGGWTPPRQLTVAQIFVLLGSFFILVKTSALWSQLLPGGMATMVVLGVPAAATWSVRRARVEGRSLARAGVGFAQCIGRPSRGSVQGKPGRFRRARLDPQPLYIAPGRP